MEYCRSSPGCWCATVGHEHLTGAVHAWCGAQLLRDLRSISEADPTGQLRALAMANTLLEAHHAARMAREQGVTVLNAGDLARIRNLNRGGRVRGQDDNQRQRDQRSRQTRER
ncbi:predicted protein [Streptomyces iranensis]|uniref:Uncharacterized protein n=1 Tax=Streptomyces iranensis TaxID=576784 RepID=A0A060ZAQ1_9ACTN|nr:hypothetical protein [Streptomyces iranensis]MBP2068602.1 hypothetical protein [Streptomyces iranensis]CDR01136.1 predicted protein [Streptomyces iranensis]